MVFCWLILGLLLLLSGVLCIEPKWHQILFRRKFFCSRCKAQIAKEEAYEDGRFEARVG